MIALPQMIEQVLKTPQHILVMIKVPLFLSWDDSFSRLHTQPASYCTTWAVTQLRRRCFTGRLATYQLTLVTASAPQRWPGLPSQELSSRRHCDSTLCLSVLVVYWPRMQFSLATGFLQGQVLVLDIDQLPSFVSLPLPHYRKCFNLAEIIFSEFQ